MNKYFKSQSIFVTSFILLIVFSIITPLIISFLGEALICYEDNDPKKLNCNRYKSSPKLFIIIIIIALIISILVVIGNISYQFVTSYNIFESIDSNNIEIPYTFIDNLLKKN